MSFHSQQELFLPSSEQKYKYTNKSHKRKKHDSNTKFKRSKSNLHKSITKQIRAEVHHEFERKYQQKYAEMNKQNEEMKKELHKMRYKLELKQKWDDDNMKALKHKPLNRADKDLFLQVRSITRDEIFHKIKFITNQKQLDAYEDPGTLGYYFIEYCKTNCPTSMINTDDGEFWLHVKDVVYKALGAKRNAVQSSLKEKFIGM